MGTPRFVAKQLSHPSGIFGRVIGRLMNRHNARINEFAVQMLEISPTDRVLEIGFGGGVTLPLLINSAAFVCGLDRSEQMLRRARAKFSEAIAAGRADFREGTVESLPLESGSFDKVITVNTVYFWNSLDAGFAEIHRVLAPGGRAVIGFLPKEPMTRLGVPSDIFTMRTPEEITSAMARAGFKSIRIERPKPTTTWNVVVASR